MFVPAVSLNESTFDTCVLPGAVVPVTSIGNEKFAGNDGAVAPLSVFPLVPKRVPSVPGSMADCRFVVPVFPVSPLGPVGAVDPSVVQRSSRVDATAFTCG